MQAQPSRGPRDERWLHRADAATQLAASVLERSAGVWPFSFKLAAARSAVAWARWRGRPAGHAAGAMLIKLDPSAIARLAARLDQGSVAISATNGKTTTATLTATLTRHVGMETVNNELGDNMPGGLATSLLLAARPRNRIRGEIGVFEVDEPGLPEVAHQLQPRVILLGNLFRDRFDRFGALERMAADWGRLLRNHAHRSRIILNADDALVGPLGQDGADCLYFGIEDTSCALPAREYEAEPRRCRRCAQPFRFTAHFLSHLGHYGCPSCGRCRPAPHVFAQEIDLRGPHETSMRLHTPNGSRLLHLRLGGLHNVYNALGAAAVGHALGIGLDQIVSALGQAEPVWGRGEEFVLEGRRVTVTSMKNQVSANSMIRTLAGGEAPIDLLGVLNDTWRYGPDVSWLWDADFERLAPFVRSATCSGARAIDLALRLKYAGVRSEEILVEPDMGAGVDGALQHCNGELYALANYQGMLPLRGALLAKGASRSSSAPGPAQPASRTSS